MTHDHEKQYQRRKRLKIYGSFGPYNGAGTCRFVRIYNIIHTKTISL